MKGQTIKMKQEYPMFPVANNELSALITKADYEHSFVWAHRALYGKSYIPIKYLLYLESYQQILSLIIIIR
ncbi:hypothetical protein HYD96_00880 [Mycoplasmopsis bovis]|nr:hypothetical protein [Mycoplasmopsis bovis]QQH34610.1 hypothetical protein HYD96_00880 [Mycoplasmopsis bovis]